MKNINSKFIISVGMLGISALGAYPWGQKGHDTACYIAEQHLTPATKAAVDSLLEGKSMVYWANWLDNASHTKEYAFSKTWHYKNIDKDVEFEKAPLLDSGDVVTAIYAQISTLKNPEATKDAKVLALKILTHIMGDIHQPMHMGHASDRGGNQWNVKFFRTPTNLHSVWDSSILEAGHKWSYTEWQQQIDRATPEEQAEILADGTPEKWGKECYEIATEIYDTTPQDYSISYDYIAKWTPIIEKQLLRAGLRLADVLNGIYDPEYTPSNQIVR